MNLWNLFPESILNFQAVIYLPCVALLLYLYLLYVLFRHAEFRPQLLLFTLLSAISSAVMFLTLGPSIGKVIPPLLLLAVMLMPTVLLIKSLSTRSTQGIKVWTVATLAGWSLSISWSAWLFMLARS